MPVQFLVIVRFFIPGQFKLTGRSSVFGCSGLGFCCYPLAPLYALISSQTLG
jgi:hypothetical protein